MKGPTWIALGMALAGCATPAPSLQGSAPVATPSEHGTGYLTAAALDGRAVLGPPPAPESAHGRADRALYDETRALAGTPRWETAIQDNDLWGGGALKRFSCAMGVRIDEGATPVAWRLLHKLEYDVRTLGTPAKDHFARRRPALGNNKPICVPREPWMETNASYPSGHAMTGWAWALVLTEARPQASDALLRIGREMGESRVICGVHFLSDIEAGRTLAAGMVARLHADPAFTTDLAQAKREIAASTQAPAGCG